MTTLITYVKSLPHDLEERIFDTAKIMLMGVQKEKLKEKLKGQFKVQEKYHQEEMRDEIEFHAHQLHMIGRGVDLWEDYEYESSASPVEDASDSTGTSFVDARCSIADMEKNLEKIEKEIEELLLEMILQKKNNEFELQELKEGHRNDMEQFGY